MIEGAIRAVAIFASAVVLISFGLFAVDQATTASETQRERLSGVDRPDPTAAQERERERKRGKVREVIDDVDDLLLSPFAGLVSSDDPWIGRGAPSLIALLVYGLGLGFLARFMSGRA